MEFPTSQCVACTRLSTVPAGSAEKQRPYFRCKCFASCGGNSRPPRPVCHCKGGGTTFLPMHGMWRPDLHSIHLFFQRLDGVFNLHSQRGWDQRTELIHLRRKINTIMLVGVGGGKKVCEGDVSLDASKCVISH